MYLEPLRQRILSHRSILPRTARYGKPILPRADGQGLRSGPTAGCETQAFRFGYALRGSY